MSRRRLTFDDHMCATDQVKVVPGQERADDTLAKAITDSALIVLPIECRIGRVAPQQVVQQAVIGHVGRARDLADVVHRRERRGEAAVDAKDFRGDDGRDREAVEHVDERLPDLDVAPPFALVVEAVHCTQKRPS